MDPRLEFLRNAADGGDTASGPSRADVSGAALTASKSASNGAATHGEVRADAHLPQYHLFKHGDAAHGAVRINYWPARRRPPEHVLVFFPGNPGIPDYYTPFLSHVHGLLPDTHAVMCAGHVGGDPWSAAEAPAQPLDLLQQVDAKVELIDAVRASAAAMAREADKPKPTIAIAGHSVGSYMASAVAQRTDVAAAYLLFPTLGWIANSYNGWTMWPMFHKPVRPLIPWLSYLVRPLLPYAGLPVASRALVSCPTTLRHVMHLAHSEMVTIRTPDEAWYTSQRDLPSGKGIYGAWSAGNIDGWVGRDGPLVREWLGDDRVVTLEGIPHAFCLSLDHSKLVADVVADWIMHGAKGRVAGAGVEHLKN